MLLASDVKEEAESVLTLVSAKIAFDWVGAVIAHVDGVHGAVLERYSAIFAGGQL